MKSKSSLIAISLFSALFLFSGCSDDPPAGFRYPLAVGNTWEYTHRWDTFYYTDSTASTYDDTTTMLFSMQVVVTDTASLGGTSGLYRMAATATDSLNSYEGIQYYSQDEDGLYLHGHEGFGSLSMPKGLPAREGQGGIYFKGMYFNNMNELFRLFQEALPAPYPFRVDFTRQTVEDPPLEVLRYPLEEGTTWKFSETYYFWRIDKQVVGEEKVVVPAGTFDCFKIKWLYDMDHNGEWDTDIFIEDYIGQEGLVQRQITVLGMIIYDNSGQVGYMDWVNKYTLEAVSLEG